ncbi:lipopolysaccharide kinase InaA family protein [uncultured Fusobacterium sp.]|uniref:protein kinase domain-containing protein n=1 Tax=uncultured Fusobacterium sp. TaxID=159267 RepID=UPI0025F4C749|nr:lipopolysaccharide kinase InaA family protein [uncultured Fusobacterium sp.]
MEINSKVTLYDEKGNRYEIEDSGKIGEGTQGAVYRIKKRNILLKLVKKVESESLREKVNRIKSLELNKKLNFAIPLLNLKIKNDEYEGYIMLLMEDMEPISKLFRTSFETFEKLKEWYQETGGIKRRVEILKKIAYNLYQLHSKGLVYGDISPNNTFVSSGRENSEAWFIDCDNIDYHYSVDYTIGTPGFCAPEIRKTLPPYNDGKKLNTIENDRYAFANLAYILIFLADPFKGSILETLSSEEDKWDDDDWEEEDNEKIFDYGEVPWVGEGDENNKPIYGLSPMMDKVIPENLRKLFDRTLGREGREVPEKRSSLRLWYEELVNFSNILNNSQCDCGYFYCDVKNRCKSCEKKSNLLLFEIDYKNRKKSKTIIKNYDGEENITIFKSDLGIGTFDEKNKEIFRLKKSNGKFYLENSAEEKKIIFKEKIGEEEFEMEILGKSKELIYDFLNLIIELEEATINIKGV